MFGEGVSFGGSSFGDNASFEGVRVGNGARFGPLLVTGVLNLDEATFSGPRTIEISAAVVSAQKIVLPFGATLRLRCAELDLEGAQFPQPTIVTLFLHPLDSWTEVILDADTGLRGLLDPNAGQPDPRPRITSLRETNVENLVLSDVNLAACHLDGAHNLDQLRWEGSTGFAHAPTVWRWRPIWPWRQGRGRQALAEEHKWRAARPWRRRKGWNPPTVRSYGERVEASASLDFRKTASLYRALRKAREDAKDEPGAADFYCGEMEMRRFGAQRGAERLLLTAYWLSCGYALRAWRAFSWLAVLLAVGAFLFATVGFDRSPIPATQPDRLMPSGQLHYATVVPRHTEAMDGLKFAVDTSTSLLHTPSDRPLTSAGSVTELVLRFAGPLLLGLALLSLRGRVKR
jgi:hypothetical protein